MTILIVDDDIDIVEGIMSGVDFAAINIDTVLCAYSAAQAKDILLTEQVDIMLTDIEMPNESGLDLLSWVRGSGYDIVSMFCTSFADFNYAKKAVEMHSFDYFLKPISYSALQARLAAAVEESQRNKNIEKYKQYSSYWLSSQKDNKQNFWTSMLFSAQGLAETQRAGVENGIEYSDDDKFTLCAVFLNDEELILPQWKIYGFRNIAEELLDESGIEPEAMIPISSGRWMLVFRVENDDNTKLLQTLARLVKCTKDYLESSLNCYYITDSLLADTRRQQVLIKDVYSDDVTSKNKLIDAGKYEFIPSSYSTENIAKWEMLLSAGKKDELLSQIDAYVDAAAERGQLNYLFLRAMRLDVIQMLYILLDKKEINVHKLFLSQTYDLLIGQSLLSAEKFKRYIRFAFDTAFDYIEFTAASQSVIGQVKDFIRLNLSEEINRTTIASKVFLNPDYLARLFKKETGMSIGAYLQETRIAEAQKLLLRTTTPVNEIAQMVGYDNFSYFSHVFRTKTGATPNEYRKKAIDNV